MKWVKINAYQVGLVFKNGVYQRMLKEGNYWFWENVQVYVYNLMQPFHVPVELNVLLQDEDLAQMLTVVNVKDNEMVLVYQDGLFQQVLTPGRYTYWNSVINYQFVHVDISKIEITENIDRAVLQNRLVQPFVRSSEVQSYEKALLFVDGKYQKVLEPGAHYWWKNSISINVAKVDTRQQQMEINGQEILTRDKAALRINAWAQYKVVDVEKTVLQNKEWEKQLYVSFQLALREYISGFSFDELLEKKESMAPLVLQRAATKAEALGVEVLGFGIRDIILPGDVKEIMNQVLVTEKKAQANIIMRREETANTRSLLNTAKLMEENAMLWKLKEMEYVEKIADKISNITVGSNGDVISQLKQIFVP
jgi:regulator of protease activity HflC (stomatin/prohibitin superfamily)